MTDSVNSLRWSEARPGYWSPNTDMTSLRRPRPPPHFHADKLRCFHLYPGVTQHPTPSKYKSRAVWHCAARRIPTFECAIRLRIQPSRPFPRGPFVSIRPETLARSDVPGELLVWRGLVEAVNIRVQESLCKFDLAVVNTSELKPPSLIYT